MTSAVPARQPVSAFESHSPSVPRLALTVTEAAESIGVSPDFFAEHVAPELRIVRRGRKRLVAVRELERWLDATAEAVPGD